MTSLEVFHAVGGVVEETPVRLTLGDRRWLLIAAQCGATVARRASHVRFVTNRFPTLQTGVYRRPPKPPMEEPWHLSRLESM